MVVEIELRKGATYFSIGFFDRDFKLPTIETYVYVGPNDDGEKGYLFMDAAGHLERRKNPNSRVAHYLFLDENAKGGIVDLKHLIQWLEEEHSPKTVGKSYEYRAI